MRRRILRSNKGPIPVNISTQNNAVIHVKTHHDKELSRLSKRANEANIQLPLTEHRKSNNNGQKDMRTPATGVLLSGDIQPQVQERRTRREVSQGMFNPTAESTALVPVPARLQNQELRKFDGDNNVRFKIQVTDKKGAQRPTKILATLSRKAAIQRQEGVVKLTRSGFQTPTIREIGSNEDIFQLDDPQSHEKPNPAKYAHDLWNEAVVKYTGSFQNVGHKPQNHLQNQFAKKQFVQPSHYKKGAGNQLEIKNQQRQYEDQDRQRYPDNDVPSPVHSYSTSDQGSDESITRSNETGSNLYGSREYRRGLRGREPYQQGASILKTATPYPGPQKVRDSKAPYYLQDNPQFPDLQPRFKCFSSVHPSEQPCVTCEFAPCSACGTHICVGCMAKQCALCSAPICSACSVESNAANNETLCMCCTLKKCSYNRSSSSGELPRHPSALQSNPYEIPEQHTQPRQAQSDPMNQGYQSNAPPKETQSAIAYRMQNNKKRTPHFFRQSFSGSPNASGVLPPGYPSSLSPCSPFIDYAARQNLPRLIPNYVCEVPSLPPQFTPYDHGFDDMSCHSASIVPRKNKFLQLMAGARPDANAPTNPSGSVCSCCCCCPQEDAGGDGTSVMCPASWVACPPTQHPYTAYSCCYEEEPCMSTLIHVALIMVPIILFYSLGYYGLTRLTGINKFTRLAAAMAILTFLYILTLEPDDLVMYASDKPKISPGHTGMCSSNMRRCSPITCPSPVRGTPGLDFSYTEPNRSAPQNFKGPPR